MLNFIYTVTAPSKWPAGSYALLKPKSGCPTGFKEGSLKHTGKGRNSNSSDFHLDGDYNAESMTHKFCVKDSSIDNMDSPQWDKGRYCFLRKGGSCPKRKLQSSLSSSSSSSSSSSLSLSSSSS